MEKLNVVLFHMGEYFDETSENYSLKPTIYKSCYESVLKEFKLDNIIIIHSLEEAFSMFKGLEKEYYEHQFFLNLPQVKNCGLHLSNDLLRLLLTKYIDNMLFLDADIYAQSGLKNDILSITPNNAITSMYGYGVIYSKHKNNSLINYMDMTFNDEDYSYDVKLIDKYYDYLFCNEETFDLERTNIKVNHYTCLGFLRKYVTEIFILDDDKYLKDLKYKKTSQSVNRVFYCKGNVHFISDDGECKFFNGWTLPTNISFKMFLNTISSDEKCLSIKKITIDKNKKDSIF